MVNSLVAEKRRSHTTDDDVDGNAERDEEACCEGMHSGQSIHRCRTAEDKHGRHDDIRC